MCSPSPGGGEGATEAQGTPEAFSPREHQSLMFRVECTSRPCGCNGLTGCMWGGGGPASHVARGAQSQWGPWQAASWSLRSARRDDQVRGSNLPEVTWPLRRRAETYLVSAQTSTFCLPGIQKQQFASRAGVPNPRVSGQCQSGCLLGKMPHSRGASSFTCRSPLSNCHLNHLPPHPLPSGSREKLSSGK